MALRAFLAWSPKSIACVRTLWYACKRTLMASRMQAKQLRDAVRQLVVAHGVLNITRRPCGAQLSVPHAYALLELLRAPEGLTTTELAAQLSIDRTNVSRLVARMEDAGEVRRRTDAQDARAKTVMLTARGKRLAQGVDESSAAHFAEMCDDLRLPVGVVLESLQALGAVMTSAGSGRYEEET